MKLLRNFIIIFFAFVLVLVLSIGVFWRYNVGAVNKKSKEKITVTIAPGTKTKDIGEELKEKGLIRSKNFFYVYLKLFKINDIKATTYQLQKSMTLEEIVALLRKGNSFNPDELKITFPEGKNMKHIADLIASKTNNKKEAVYDKLKDTKYLDSLIKKYWFLTDEIKNPYIFYPLEGYLFPETYIFKDKDVKVETIFEKMLDTTSKKLESHKAFLAGADYSIHEYLTLASIVEVEGIKMEDRKLVAGVFYNRLKQNEPLGSDVTTYYAARLDMSERDLLAKELNDINMYNTRSMTMAGKLPVGPVSNPSIDAIVATLYPTESDYLFFVADKYRRVYFTKTLKEHQAKTKEIKEKGDWLEWAK